MQRLQCSKRQPYRKETLLWICSGTGDDIIEEMAKPLAFSGGTDKRTMMLAVPWNKLYLREIIMKNHIRFVEGVDFGEDMLFNINFYWFAERIRFIEDSLYYHTIAKSSLSSSYREKRFLQASTAFRCYHEWFPEDFNAQKYHSSIVSLNRNCIKYSAEKRGFQGLKQYLSSTQDYRSLLDASYEYKYNNVLLKTIIRSTEVRYAVIPFAKHYVKKMLRRRQ